jgi:hypothetical protein
VRRLSYRPGAWRQRPAALSALGATRPRTAGHPLCAVGGVADQRDPHAHLGRGRREGRGDSARRLPDPRERTRLFPFGGTPELVALLEGARGWSCRPMRGSSNRSCTIRPAGTDTKGGEARTFPSAEPPDLKVLLEAPWAARDGVLGCSTATGRASGGPGPGRPTRWASRDGSCTGGGPALGASSEQGGGSRSTLRVAKFKPDNTAPVAQVDRAAVS